MSIQKFIIVFVLIIFINNTPGRISSYIGPLETVDEIPTNTNYYDGSLNLNINRVIIISNKKIDCHLIAIPFDCYIASTCGKTKLIFKGWCGSTNTCIRGSLSAPIEPC